jgi:hypothetical protein
MGKYNLCSARLQVVEAKTAAMPSGGGMPKAAQMSIEDA